MKTVQQNKSGAVYSENYSSTVGVGKKGFVERLSFEPGIKHECVMEGESGEQVGDELESVASSAECQGWRNETGSWFQR